MEPFYSEGLRFECQQCGACCTGEPGYVYVTERESQALAGRLGLSVAEFYRRHVRLVPGGHSLLERPDGSCIFYDRGCTVYSLRPRQCRTYPFWTGVLHSEQAWQEEGQNCPGVGSGKLYDLVTIEKLLRGEGQASANA